MNSPRVSSLWIYPIKSCRGINVHELEFTATGIKYDRQWMIVDEKNKFLTLRSEPKLALIKTAIDSTDLIVSFNSQTFKVNLSQKCKNTETVKIWQDEFTAGIEADAVNTALSEFLGKSVKLVRYQDESFRHLNQAATSAVKQFMFADSRPVLLVNESSLQDLNEKLTELSLQPSAIERFRPNVVVDGLVAFHEDKFSEMKIGEVEFLNPKLCPRCPIVTQEIASGDVVSKETLVVLSKYRRLSGNKVMFGVYWTPASLGVLKVRDLLTYKSLSPN